MPRDCKGRSLRRASRAIAAGLVTLFACGFAWPWGGSWPSGSDAPVEPLGAPSLESHIAGRGGVPDSGFRFVAYGDQRALADGEWQSILAHVAALGARDPGFLFVIDTGDLVDDGRHANQFAHLRDLLAPVRRYPYLVSAGNHEVRNNRSPVARRHLATFLTGLDPDLSAERLYFRKDVGPLRLLFLDTNDLVYGDAGDHPDRTEPAAGSRAEAQLQWLEKELAEDDREGSALTVVVMHHPFVQSSKKHRAHAAALWSYRWAGRTLPALLLDGGTDVVLAGHTHTTERFRVRRESDGAELRLVNLSGRPRDGFLWFGSGSRRSRNIAGQELEWLAENGWDDLSGWTVTQEHAMVEEGANQFGVFRVTAQGGLELEMTYLAPDDPAELRRDPPIALH